jgi:V8-like Glu-specific endopeptidase
VVFSDGNVATVGQTYTLAEIQSATFEPTLNAQGQGSFTFTVAGFNPILSLPDPSALTETVNITVTGVNATTANQLYVAQLYRDLLDRNADANGLNFWSNVLNGGSALSTVVLGIEGSTEYRTDEIQALFQQLLHRPAEAQGQNFYLSQMAQGETIDQVRIEIAASPEYFQTQGGSTLKGYVDALYADLLDRSSDSAGESYWLSMLSDTANRTAVAQGIAGSSEALAIRTTSLYQQILRRAPDLDGLKFNESLMAQSGQAAVVANLASSDEYFEMYAGNGGQSRDLLTELSAAGLIAPQTQNEEGDATKTTGFPSVGIISLDGQGFGGGTLIAPMFVLTAAHVVDGRDPSTLTFTVGGATYNVAQVFEYPGYNPGEIGTDGANDIAILELTRTVTNVTPSPINTTAPAVGQMLTLVGFGARDGGTFGTKYSGTTPIGGISSSLITWTFSNNSEDDTVVGDSGSPEFIEENGVYYIASVTSGGTNLDSGFGDNAYNTRVDVYAAWIDSIAGT